MSTQHTEAPQASRSRTRRSGATTNRARAREGRSPGSGAALSPFQAPPGRAEMQRTKGPGCVGQPTTWGTDELAGLLVPVDPARPVAIVPVPNTAAGISTVIGGGLVDDTRIGVVAGRRFTLYLTEHRTTAPPNPRARKLVRGLGHPLSEDEEITGDVL